MADPDMIAKLMALYVQRYPSANEKTIKDLVIFHMSHRYNYDSRARKVFDNGFEPDDVSNSKIHRNITVITHSRKKFITEWESSTFVIPASLGSSPTTLNVARIFCGE